MYQNPINKERIIRVEEQLLFWCAGTPMHNGQHRNVGECTPDFSCCSPDLLNDSQERIRVTLESLKTALVEELVINEAGKSEIIVRRWFDNLISDISDSEIK